VIGLLTLEDCFAIQEADYWPLSQRALNWISEAPQDRARRRRRKDLRIANIAVDVLAADLPAALDYLLQKKAGGV
jgi:hypothetical protein